MRGAMRGMVVLVAVLATGCLARRSSLLLERQARGPIHDEPSVAQSVAWKVEPVLQTQAKQNVEITVNYASAEYLRNLFNNKAMFGAYAGRNPYFPENMVFYVSIANRSEKKIRINPAEFILLDDHGNQYAMLGIDYVTAFGESRKPVSSVTRGMLESASPGYFGISVPIGKVVASKPQGQFALLQQSSLQSGYLYPGVVHDGLVAFWNPPANAKKIRLLLTNVKSDFDPSDFPKESLEFIFEFNVAKR